MYCRAGPVGADRDGAGPMRGKVGHRGQRPAGVGAAVGQSPAVGSGRAAPSGVQSL